MFPRVDTAATIEKVPKMELAALQIPATSLPRLFRLPLPNVKERLLAQVGHHGPAPALKRGTNVVSTSRYCGHDREGPEDGTCSSADTSNKFAPVFPPPSAKCE